MKLLLCVPVLVALFAFSCPPPTPPAPPPNGFSVQTYYQEFVNNMPTTPAVLMPLVGVNSHFLFATQPTQGTHGICNHVTDFQSLMQCPDRRVPAVWELTFTSGPCFGKSDATDVDIQPGSKVNYICEVHRGGFFLTTESIDVNAPPATLQLTGYGMDATFGMPVIKIINSETGDVATWTTASTMNPDGTWVEAPTPYLGFTYSGQYVVIVYNVKSDGSLEGIGGDWLDIYGNDPPPPPPPGPCPVPDPDMPPMPCESNNY